MQEHDGAATRPSPHSGSEQNAQLPLLPPDSLQAYTVAVKTVPARTVFGEITPQTKQFVAPPGKSLPVEITSDDKTPAVPSHLFPRQTIRGAYYDQPRPIRPKR